MTADERRDALGRARLYLICDIAQLERAPYEGIDILQLRDKHAPADELLAAARVARTQCDQHGVLFIVNDDPRLAVAAGADGVHVGQDDMSVEEARAIVGPDRLIGRSTHTPEQVDTAAGVDYIGVGPVHATPTKPGRAAVGLDLVRYAAAHARVPFFAIGGIDRGNVAAVRAAGAERIAVVRAIAASADPAAAAAALAVPRTDRRQAAAENCPAPEPAPASGEPEAAPKESRSERRSAAVRAGLEPLGPGQLPPALAISIAVAAVLGLGNLAAYAAGVKINGRHPGPGIISFSVVMGIGAWGMWAHRYWAVLGFQALVALTVLYFCLLLTVASNVAALVVCLSVIGLGSWLFWKLVRVLARLQAPTSTSP